MNRKARVVSLLEHARQKLRWALLTTKPFRLFQWLGIHLTPIHFYSPIPDVRELDPSIWAKPSELPGVTMQDEQQQRLMESCFSRYQPECDFPTRPTAIPYDFYTTNIYFGYASAVAMYSFVRQRRPERIVEIGAGNTTYLLARALERNKAEGATGTLTSIDPYTNETLRAGFPGLTRLIQAPVQQVPMAEFTSLKAGDILSIDSSHAVRTGGDVNFIYLEVLPRLAPGVLIHIHDIFFPEEYPRAWLERRFFWNEQYLLHAFLIGNSNFHVVWGQRYAELRFPELYSRTFAHRTGWEENSGSYSFWIESRRT